MDTISANTYNYFLKGDISGIQEFIFNVKSEKAARVLKARSVFIQLFSEFAEKFVREELTPLVNSTKRFYNGGGTFFFYISSSKEHTGIVKAIKDIEKILNEIIAHEDVYIALSCVDIPTNAIFSDYWQQIAKQSNQDKLAKFAMDITQFTPYAYNYQERNLKEFAYKLPKVDGAETILSKEVKYQVFEHYVGLFRSTLALSNYAGEDYFENKVHNKLPYWRSNLFQNPKFQNFLASYNSKKEQKEKVKSGDIIDFQSLAYFAQQRTGTNKLGVLKMDVDDLGYLFNKIPSQEAAKRISDTLTLFFEQTINILLDFSIADSKYYEENLNTKNPLTFRDNIYTIFSGGDDCIFVGGWDIILKWAQLIQDSFQSVVKKIKKEIGKEPTISAGVIILEPTYPVIRFAQLAEEAISKAKEFKFWDKTTNTFQKTTKNKICLFDEVLSWDEFKSAEVVAKDLAELINKGESRTIIERIRNSATGFKKLQEEAIAGKVVGPSVAKLFYYVRHSKEKNKLTQKLITPYANDLIAAFVGKESINPMKYPVAARWAEFLTRKNS